jgi:hypothetical protein
MLDQLTDLVKKISGQSVIDNPEIPNEKNEDVMAEASNTVVSGLQNILSGGGLQNILNLFSYNSQKAGGANGLLQNPIVNMMVGHFTRKLMGKFGLQSNAASGVASGLIPGILNSLISKTRNNADTSIDLNRIISSLTGGNVEVAAAQPGYNGGGIDFQDMLNQFTGAGNNPNGGNGIDLNNIISQVSRAAQQSQENQVKEETGGAGLLDVIKGFFK